MAFVTRRGLVGLLLAAPASALAARRWPAPPGGVYVDVSPLRARGDTIDADFVEAYLPGYLRQLFGPGRHVEARIDDMDFGSPGSDGKRDNEGAVDTIQGVGRIDGREIPVQSTVQVTSLTLPDVGGFESRQRQLLLTQSFAQWFARDAGVYR